MRLKLGSRKVVSSPDEMVDSSDILEHNEINGISAESMSSDLSSVNEGAVRESSSDKSLQSTCISGSESSICTARESRNMSIMYLFYKYKHSSCPLKGNGVQNDEPMVTEEEGSLTAYSTSTGFSDCEITDALS